MEWRENMQFRHPKGLTTGHPTETNKTFSDFILDFTDEGETICDPFMVQEQQALLVSC